MMKLQSEGLATNTYILVRSNHEEKKIAHLQRKRIPGWIVNCVSTQVLVLLAHETENFIAAVFELQMCCFFVFK
jgi:hypothetical protein